MKKIIEIDTERLYNGLFYRIPVGGEYGSNEFDSFCLYELGILNEEEYNFLLEYYDCKPEQFKNIIFGILYNDCDQVDAIESIQKSMTEEAIIFFKKMPYQMFLNTYYWKTISDYKKEQFGNKCQLCGSEKYLNTHHRDYSIRGEEFKNLNELTVLCNKCHSKFHDK